MQHHPPQHKHQGSPPTTQQPLHSRRSGLVQRQQQHHQQQSQHQAAYSSTHSLSQAYSAAAASTANAQDGIGYYSHPSPYSSQSANSGYAPADTSDMMAAAQLPRHHYPPMHYHTPQSNSPVSVASAPHHEQHRSIYAHPQPQHLPPQPMYYQPQPYQSMPTQPSPSPYAQSAPHSQQPMTSQANMMLSHAAPQNHMAQHASQQEMTGSPRPKMEAQLPLQLQQQQKQQPQNSPLSQSHHTPNGSQLHSPSSHAGNLNSNAAPGPIPATTPLVVRQDGNGVQWIAFEYSRDRVKVQYTIRCDVESVNTDELSADFKQENCVYPRACCPKDQYRGNRLIYETDCNRVGWALAELNLSLRGKRGLIQRAVDSWRNSNQDPRLRSRRVRRMAKLNTRKVTGPPQHPGAHMLPPGTAGMGAGPGSMGAPHNLGKPGLASMPHLHHPHAGHPNGAPQGGDEVVAGRSFEDQHHHHSMSLSQHSQGHPSDVRQAQVFAGYGPHGYPPPISAAGGPMAHMPPQPSGLVPARRRRRDDEPDDLFPDMPEAKKRKFILVEDNVRNSRLRVRVTLEGVDTNEIPDSFRKGASVFPRTYFPREMQSPPPSATGSRFFEDDASEDDGTQETEGRGVSRRGAGKYVGQKVEVPMTTASRGEVTVPKMTRAARGREVRLNDLGYRMAWLQSRVFAGRRIFLQRALDCYRNKTRAAVEGSSQDIKNLAPHYETRPGKRRWSERMKRGEKEMDD